jgi:methionyl-tRNA synthetase
MVIGSWGNLVNRVTKLSEKYEIKKANLNNNTKLKSWFDDINLDIMKELLEKRDIKLYLEKWYSLVQKTNEYISSEEPWKKHKDENTK